MSRMKERERACEAAHDKHMKAAEILRGKADQAGTHGEHDRFWILLRKAQTHEVLARNFA